MITSHFNNKKKVYIITSIVLIYFYLKSKNSKQFNTKTLTKKQIQFINSILPSTKIIEQKIGVPYQFIIAQICIESGFGKSLLTTKYFNYGGIKAIHGLPSVKLLTTECDKNGNCKKVYQNFAVFENAFTGLMYQAKIYSNKYFKQYLNKTTNPFKYVELLQSGAVKYATSPTYVQTITNILNKIIASGF